MRVVEQRLAIAASPARGRATAPAGSSGEMPEKRDVELPGEEQRADRQRRAGPMPGEAGRERTRARRETGHGSDLDGRAKRISARVGLLADTVRSRVTWPAGGPKRQNAASIAANTAPASPRSLVQKFLERSKTPELLQEVDAAVDLVHVVAGAHAHRARTARRPAGRWRRRRARPRRAAALRRLERLDAARQAASERADRIVRLAGAAARDGGREHAMLAACAPPPRRDRAWPETAPRAGRPAASRYRRSRSAAGRDRDRARPSAPRMTPTKSSVMG